MKRNYYYSIGPRWTEAKGKYAENNSLLSIDVLNLLLGRATLPNPIFYGEEGFEQYDVLTTIHPAIFLFSSRMRNFLVGQEIQQWTSRPVQVVNNRSSLSLAYHIFQFPSQPVAFDYSRSEITSRSENFIDIKGQYFDVDPPAGVDIFSVKNTAFIFITERLQLLLYKEDFANLAFERNDRMTGMVPIEIFYR